jgi:hypothetical protein
VKIMSANGYAIQIDGEDFERISAHKWSVYEFGAGMFYATTSVNSRTVYMHRFLMDAPSGIEVDHKDGDGLNNRRQSNLRLATHMQNLANQHLSRANTSGYRGVVRTRCGKWHAQIKHRGKHISCGNYETREDAAAARIQKEQEIFGEFARSL